MRVSDWSSDVCSSDLIGTEQANNLSLGDRQRYIGQDRPLVIVFGDGHDRQPAGLRLCGQGGVGPVYDAKIVHRSEEHTSELQSLMRISYAVFCLKKKISKHRDHTNIK